MKEQVQVREAIRRGEIGAPIIRVDETFLCGACGHRRWPAWFAGKVPGGYYVCRECVADYSKPVLTEVDYCPVS